MSNGYNPSSKSPWDISHFGERICSYFGRFGSGVGVSLSNSFLIYSFQRSIFPLEQRTLHSFQVRKEFLKSHVGLINSSKTDCWNAFACLSFWLRFLTFSTSRQLKITQIYMAKNKWKLYHTSEYPNHAEGFLYPHDRLLQNIKILKWTLICKYINPFNAENTEEFKNDLKL